MTIFNVISLFGGLALFLYGMRIMGDGLKRSSSSALKAAMEKVTNNPFVGFLLGLTVTAVIQSSTATIVLTSGMVGAGILTLHQSIGIILGANVGTTVTGQIIRLLDINAGGTSWLNFFKPSTLAPIAAVIGILLIMAFRFRSSDTIGGIAMGFSILFTGLLNMTAAVDPLSQSPAFAQLFVNFADKPLLGFLAGTVVAFITQSSSATVGILQALSLTGQLSFSSIYSILVGIYLGDCVTTAIVCSIGARADAKRTGMVNILFNLSEMILVPTVVNLLHSFGLLSRIWSAPISSGGIANSNGIFNLSCAILLLPVCSFYEKLSRKIIKDDKEPAGAIDRELELLDRAFFSSPALALSGAHEAIGSMSGFACGNVTRAMQHLNVYDDVTVNTIKDRETHIDSLCDHVSGYLVELSPHIDPSSGTDRLNYFLKCATEFERIGDHAVNLTENAGELSDKQEHFSDKARAELDILCKAINEVMSYASLSFTDLDIEAARHIEPLEEVIDEMVDNLRENHLQRLRGGTCSAYAGSTFLDILTNLERISDQCSNIGVHTIMLLDPQAAEMEHDYIQHLHQGFSESYNAEFRADRERYFSLLDALPAEKGE